jgi:hypothetical protein
MTYNWDDMELISCTEETQYVPINQFEPNQLMRKYMYPNVKEAKVQISIYKKKNGEYVKRKKYNYIKMVPEGVAERKTWEKFGKALDGKNVTSLGDEVFLELKNGGHLQPETVASEVKKEIEKVCEPKKYVPPSFKSKYVPPSARGRKNKDSTINSEDSSSQDLEPKKVTRYVPPSKRGDRPSFSSCVRRSVIISNLPDYLEVSDLKWLLDQKFSKFGHIRKINVLTKKYTGEIRGIAFIDFSTNEEALFAVEKGNGIHIEHNIVQVRIAEPKK